MVTRDLLKNEIDKVQDRYLEALYRIVKALEDPSGVEKFTPTNLLETFNWKEFIKETYGCMADEPIEREEQEQYEFREVFN